MQDFITFDDNSWKITYKLPQYFSRDIREARSNMTKALERYFALPKSARDDCAWLFRVLEAEMSSSSIDVSDVAALFSTSFWV